MLTRAASEPDKQSKERRLFLSCFDVRRFECGGWKFQGTILTDGIQCSVTIERPKTARELEVDALSKKTAAARKAHNAENKARKANGESVLVMKKTPDEIALENYRAERAERERLRAVDILGFHRDDEGDWQIKEGAVAPIGIDPGLKRPFTAAVWSAEAEKALWKRNESGTVGAPSADNIPFETRSLTRYEYYKLAGFNKRADVVRQHIDACPEVAAWNEGDAESSKTSDVSRYSHYLSALFDMYDSLMEMYCGKRWWRRIKGGTYVKQQQMAEEAVRQMTDVKSHKKQKDVVVLYGDSSIGQLKGCAPVGNKRLRQIMKHRACVIDVDEFRTSKLCACCHKAMKGKLMDNGERSYGIRHCENSECERVFWDRDDNGGINITFKGLWPLRGEETPIEFMRGFVELDEVVEVEQDAATGNGTDEILMLHD